MKIAFLSYMGRYTSPPRAYGGEGIMWNIVDELAKMGHEITLYASPGSQTPENGRLVEMSSIDDKGNLIAQLEHRNVALHLDEILKHDIVHDCSNFKYAHYYTSVFQQEKKGLAYLISNDWFNLMHPQHIVLLSWKQKLLCEAAAHSYNVEPYPHYVFHAMNSLINVINPLYVYPDIDLEQFQPNYEKEDYVCWFGRFVPEKGPVKAIEAAVKAGVKMKITGSLEAPDHKEYFEGAVKPLLEKHGIEYVSTPDTNSLINFVGKAKAFVFPCSFQESFGLVTLQSMALGTPVLTTCMGAQPEIVQNGKSGFIVPNTVDAFAEYIGRIDELKPENARRRATYFKKGTAAKQFEQIYTKMLDGTWPVLQLPFVVHAT